MPGLAVGDTSSLDPATETAMTASSLSHLTAVSGANCALVVGAAFGLLGRVRGAALGPGDRRPRGARRVRRPRHARAECGSGRGDERDRHPGPRVRQTHGRDRRPRRRGHRAPHRRPVAVSIPRFRAVDRSHRRPARARPSSGRRTRTMDAAPARARPGCPHVGTAGLRSAHRADRPARPAARHRREPARRPGGCARDDRRRARLRRPVPVAARRADGSGLGPRRVDRRRRAHDDGVDGPEPPLAGRSAGLRPCSRWSVLRSRSPSRVPGGYRD